MISDMRAKHGKDSVNLSKCGKFTLAEDLSGISDIASIDLSDIESLEGELLELIFLLLGCSPSSLSRGAVLFPQVISKFSVVSGAFNP